VCLVLAAAHIGHASPRRPQSEADVRFWLENMLTHHGYSVEETAAATGLSPDEIAAARTRWSITTEPPQPKPEAPLKVLPYPGGRHPRLGFFDGAVDPQRDTKLSVFAPWDGGGYVVVDVPEAVWSNLGLTYLAHTHIDTIWTKQKVELEPVEWSRRADGSLAAERRLPNGIAFGARAVPRPGHVKFRWWVRNGTDAPLTGLRAQVCAMLGRAAGFSAQSDDNKVLDPPFAAARDTTGTRWVITAWEPLDRAWQNPPVPCLHADPALPDCPPGETRSSRGWLWFYEGADLPGELARLRSAFLEKPATPEPSLAPVPDKLVVLTFDDSCASHATGVAPLLKKLGFGATFFITEGFSFLTDKNAYMTWEQIAGLHRDGFEIGNHTRSHLGLNATSLNRLRGELDHINSRCAEHGIPKPVSFAYPGNAIHPAALDILRGAGITWARRGAQPEFTYESGRGVAYDPRHDDPRLIPTAGDARPDWSLENLQQAVAGARDGRIAVLQFHGAPDLEHPWVHTPPERFTEYMTWLKDNGYHAIALRDLARFIDPADAPLEPMAVIERRQAALSGQ
jgi:peptidoglycan/xylan/chitin deacetylase (PgdA/CDA1 family)